MVSTLASRCIAFWVVCVTQMRFFCGLSYEDNELFLSILLSLLLLFCQWFVHKIHVLKIHIATFLGQIRHGWILWGWLSFSYSLNLYKCKERWGLFQQRVVVYRLSWGWKFSFITRFLVYVFAVQCATHFRL